MSPLGRGIILGLALGLLCLTPAYAQEQEKEKPPKKPWTGRLADGRVITKADLDKIIKEHKLWLESAGKKGKMADLSKANLSGAWLWEANLSGAILSMANLSGANMMWADLKEANLWGANLKEANLWGANLSKADLSWANLSGAELARANLSGADLSPANLSGANLREADLSEADLSEADLSEANLSGARFEPKPGGLPEVTGLLNLQGLAALRYWGRNSYGLVKLREIFKNAGMREEERQVTYALNRNRRVNAWAEIKKKAPKQEQERTEEAKQANKEKEESEKEESEKEEPAKEEKEKKITWLDMEIARLEYYFQLIFFEWTCDYGMTPGRPLRLMFGFLLVFALPYLLALRSRDPETGLWVLLLPDRVLDRELKGRPVKLTTHRPFHPLPVKIWPRFRSRLGRAWRALRLAFYFSLLSAFHLGWRELNVGNWIARLQKKEYVLRATGWPRTVSGLQSLISVYLVALWVLSYFGRPFE